MLGSAWALREDFGVGLVSTGATPRHQRDGGLPISDVSEFTAASGVV